jgi:hypothetical protein
MMILLLHFMLCFSLPLIKSFHTQTRMHLTSTRLNYRVQSLKFKSEEQSDLNDILLRVSAFGLFIYAVFSVIAGHLNAFTNESNLLVMITGILSVVQVEN